MIKDVLEAVLEIGQSSEPFCVTGDTDIFILNTREDKQVLIEIKFNKALDGFTGWLPYPQGIITGSYSNTLRVHEDQVHLRITSIDSSGVYVRLARGNVRY